MSNWKDMFKPFILERGKEYYDCGYVEMLDSEEPLIQALVLGSQVYQVNIQKTGGHVTAMHCNCPYARKGENCKHMAAVLYALEEEKSDPQVDWQSALAQMPEKSSGSSLPVWLLRTETCRSASCEGSPVLGPLPSSGRML